MKFFKKIKFIHVVILILLYMGINIGMKVHTLNTIINSSYVNEDVLVESIEFDNRIFNIYFNEAKHDTFLQINGVDSWMNKGYPSKDKSEILYFDDSLDPLEIYADNEKLEPIKKIESNKFHNLYVYVFDSTKEIIAKNEEENNHLFETNLVTKTINLDLNKLENLVKTWKEYPKDDTLKPSYINPNLLRIHLNNRIYNPANSSFDVNVYSFARLKHDKIIITIENKTDLALFYELTNEQYIELENFIKQ